MNKALKQLDDQELVRGFMAGNEKCFQVLLERHKSKIFTTIYLIAKDRPIAEDLFQEVMIKVVNMIRAGSYNEEGKFLPWASRIARNLAIDHFRKAQRNPLQRENDNFDIFASALNKSDESPEQKIIRAENVRYVRDMVQQLPEKQREVLIMRHYADLSFREIADLTNVSINTALGRMRYALINLRKLAGLEVDEANTNYGEKLQQE